MLVEHIKQYPGYTRAPGPRASYAQCVCQRARKAPFPALSPAEQTAFYKGTAEEAAERHKFPRRLKAWGAEQIGTGIRSVCESDAIDNPDHKGFWTTLSLERSACGPLVVERSLVVACVWNACLSVPLVGRLLWTACVRSARILACRESDRAWNARWSRIVRGTLAGRGLLMEC